MIARLIDSVEPAAPVVLRRRRVLLLLVGAIVVLLLLIKNIILRQASFWMNHLILIIADVSLLILISLLWCQKLRRLVMALFIFIIKQRVFSNWAGWVVRLVLLNGILAEQGLLRYHLVGSFGSFRRY